MRAAAYLAVALTFSLAGQALAQPMVLTDAASSAQVRPSPLQVSDHALPARYRTPLPSSSKVYDLKYNEFPSAPHLQDGLLRGDKATQQLIEASLRAYDPEHGESPITASATFFGYETSEALCAWAKRLPQVNPSDSVSDGLRQLLRRCDLRGWVPPSTVTATVPRSVLVEGVLAYLDGRLTSEELIATLGQARAALVDALKECVAAPRPTRHRCLYPLKALAPRAAKRALAEKQLSGTLTSREKRELKHAKRYRTVSAFRARLERAGLLHKGDRVTVETFDVLDTLVSAGRAQAVDTDVAHDLGVYEQLLHRLARRAAPLLDGAVFEAAGRGGSYRLHAYLDGKMYVGRQVRQRRKVDLGAILSFLTQVVSARGGNLQFAVGATDGQGVTVVAASPKALKLAKKRGWF